MLVNWTSRVDLVIARGGVCVVVLRSAGTSLVVVKLISSSVLVSPRGDDVIRAGVVLTSVTLLACVGRVRVGATLVD